MGNGKKIKFWSDVWTGEVPLKVRFHNLFKICRNPKQLACQVVENDMLQIDFRRNFGDKELQEWNELIEIVDKMVIRDEPDRVVWALNKSGLFTTSSLYRNIMDPGHRDRRIKEIWEARMPMKVRIFLWQVHKYRIKSADQLKRKNWKGDEHCKMCGESEDANHIIFQCPIAVFQWAITREVLSWRGLPNNLEQFYELVGYTSRSQDRKTALLLLGAISWSLWLTRNDLIFDNSY